ncbi:hypothetical protein TIFTF001_010194 [Ficus carica]|uniref:Uncharacterized protein n=1 Tax=Ficus carica TaxID=3494 RepID=A0AA88AII9_FICCA|nr:hypothetical protein TIFTF001_010194 [Ficus carica]
MLALSAAAQDSERAPSPAPALTIGSGAGLVATFSGVFLVSSQLFSLVVDQWEPGSASRT